MNWDTIVNWFQAESWVIQIFLIIFATGLIHFLEKRIFSKIHNRLLKTQSIWDDALIRAIHRPIEWTIWLLGLTYAAEVASFYTPEFKLFSFIPSLRQAGVVTLFVWIGLRFINYVEKNILESDGNVTDKVDVTTANAISQILRIAVIATGILVILPIFNIEVTGLLAVGGAGTLIAGLAAKDLLANFFGAFVIYLDRPFAVGDWIRSPDRELEGTVEYIGWRLTRIRTFDKRPLYVPNSVFTTITVENPSRMTNRRIREVIGIRYKDASSLRKITEDIRDMLLNHPEIDATKACFVNLVSFGPSSLDILVYTFTKTTEWIPFQEIKQDIMMSILDIVTQHEASVAFPTSTVEIPDGLDLGGNNTMVFESKRKQSIKG